jgi:endonuclease/exonuclease/phosphatase family metal-dependent hydrolase
LHTRAVRRRDREGAAVRSRRKRFIGLLPSWPTFLFFKCLMLPLDHCLVSHDIRVADARTGEPIGSDHLPLIVEIELEVKQ